MILLDNEGNGLNNSVVGFTTTRIQIDLDHILVVVDNGNIGIRAICYIWVIVGSRHLLVGYTRAVWIMDNVCVLESAIKYLKKYGQGAQLWG